MLGRDAFAYGLSKIIPGLAAFASVVLFTRLIGERAYGQYALIFSVGAAAASLFGGWLQQAILRFHSDPRTQAGDLRAAIRRGNAVSILLCGACLFALMLFRPRSAGEDLVPVALSAVLAALVIKYTSRLAEFQAHLQPGAVAMAETARAASGLGLALLLAYVSTPGYAPVTVGVCAGYAIALLGGRLWWRGAAASIPTPSGEPGLMGRMLRFGLPLSLWLGGSMLLPVIDRSLIARYLGLDQTGVYAAIYDIIVRGYGVCLLPITLAIHARMMVAFNGGDPRRALALVATGLRWQLVVFVVSLAAAAVAGPALLRYALGLTQTPSLHLVLPLTAGGFIWQLALLVHKPLEMANRTHWMVAYLGAALLVAVAVNVALLPRLGLQAAAYATLISGLIYVGLCGMGYRSLRSGTGVFAAGGAS